MALVSTMRETETLDHKGTKTALSDAYALIAWYAVDERDMRVRWRSRSRNKKSRPYKGMSGAYGKGRI